MAISADRREVACISLGTTCSKVIVWNCYASSSLLPTFPSLRIRNCVQSKRQVLEKVSLLLKQFGSNLFNFVHPHGASLLMDAVDQVNDEMLDVILQYAAKQETKVSLEADGEGENAVELALTRGSPEVASKLMKYLMERVTHEGQLARILKRIFVSLNKNYHKIFIETLHHPKLFSTITDLKLPEAMMAQGRFIESTSDLLFATEEDAEEIWWNRCKKELDEAGPVTAKAVVKVLPYPNACQLGQEGLLRTMLVNGASDVCFASFAVKSIVTHKWRKYAERYFRQEFMYYGVLLLAFTVYSFLLHYQDTYNAATGKGNEKNEWETIVALGFCWILAVPKLIEEFMQAHFYWRGYGLRGIFYWLSSGWNWMEMLCYFMIIFVIPAGQFGIFKEGKRATVLSAIVAAESILLWFKMLYFARPFRKTGPLVIIVSAIARDIMPFLILAACVMFGFTVAFFVLFRHFKSGASGSLIDPQTESEEGPAEPPENMEDIEFSFGNFGRTLFTVTGYMFGEFDSSVIFQAPEQATAIALFMLYMVIITIILLNMLIAIMGDSFNRIKSSEEMQFIKARGVAIDDVESMLSFKQKEALEGSVGRYLHVAIPKYLHNKIITYRKKRLARRAGRKDRSQDKMHQILSMLNRLVRKKTGANRMESQRMEPDFMDNLMDQDKEFDPLTDPAASDVTDASSTSSSSIEGEGEQDEDSLSSFSSRD